MRLVSSIISYVLLACLYVQAAEISFELYTRQDGGRELVASGVKTYSPSDFAVSRQERPDGSFGTTKALALHEGFGVGLLETYDSVGGFGLSVEHLPLGSRPNDFSWEWYDLKAGSEYSKRQGGTKIEVLFGGFPATSYVQTVRFVEDVEFRYVEDMCCKDSDGGPTHVLRILSGSVLEFPR